jgi:hypothetical protein
VHTNTSWTDADARRISPETNTNFSVSKVNDSPAGISNLLIIEYLLPSKKVCPGSKVLICGIACNESNVDVVSLTLQKIIQVTACSCISFIWSPAHTNMSNSLLGDIGVSIAEFEIAMFNP